MQRYYIAPIVGSGTRSDPYRVSLSQYTNLAYTSIIPSDPVTGAPTSTWAICLVDALDHTALLADSNLFSFPNALPSTLISSLSNQERNRIRNGLTKFGISTTLLDTSVTLQDLVNKLGTLLDPNFDPVAFNAVAL